MQHLQYVLVVVIFRIFLNRILYALTLITVALQEILIRTDTEKEIDRLTQMQKII